MMDTPSIPDVSTIKVPPSISSLNEYLSHRDDGFDSNWRPSSSYHEFVPLKGHPRIAGLNDEDVFAYSERILGQSKPQMLFGHWFELLKEPFVGITSDGIRKNGLYTLADEGAPTKAMVSTANKIIGTLSSVEKNKICCEVDAVDWRKWCNPEIIFHDVGIRLEFLETHKIDMIFDLLKASLSVAGYDKVVSAMRFNHFLGEIVHAKSILNQYSYHFLIFGKPSESEPWGFSLFGHHLCLNVFVLRKQMSISPAFIGAEPNMIDHGPWRGLRLFTTESTIALQLMQSLCPELQSRAQIYKKMHDPAMPEGRWHPADQRHLGGAFQDNRVIPYEGIRVIEMTPGQQGQLLVVVAAFLEFLPQGPLRARMRQIDEYLAETYFSWIGAFGNEDPFYYRIQSPVVCVEFDHHAGVFLLNREPAKFHVHTLVRTPNGNDYGKQWLKSFQVENERKEL